MKGEVNKATYEANIETGKHMLIDEELPLDKITKFSNLPIEVVEDLKREFE